MAGFRQTLNAMLAKAMQGCIDNTDQQYARQLATMLERRSLILRAHFGGKPLWAAFNIKLRPKQKEPE